MRVWGYFRIHAFRSIDYRSLSSKQASFASESAILWCAEKQVGVHGPSDGNTETYADRIGAAPGESFWKYARRDRHLLWINSALHPSGVAKFNTSFGWEKGGNVISAGWQVTLCVTAAAHEVRRAERSATWNALPDHIRAVADPVKFRKLLKSHYFSQDFNICWFLCFLGLLAFGWLL